MEIEKNIERIISEKGLMKQFVAAKCGYSGNTFSAMLHGRKKITALDVVKIAEALDVTPNELFGFATETSA